MNIRQATANDIEAIHALGQGVAEFSVGEETVSFWPKELLTHAIASSDVLILIAEEQELIGFLIVNYSHGLKKAIIENVFVRPDMRGQGVGDRLLEKMLAELRALGCEYIATLIPLDAQGAADLYLRSGFSQCETFVWFDKALADTFKKLP